MTDVETIVMGSQPSACDTPVYFDPYISPRHCRITREPHPDPDTPHSLIMVEDLGSTNGTWINGHRIYGPTELRIGDVLKIGRTAREIPPHAFWRDI